MTNKQFDEMVRRRIETEDMTMSKQTENRLMDAMQRPQTQHPARRMTARTLALAMLILVLLCGAALAAVNWSSREFLTYTDPEGVPHVNEELAQYAQPVGKTFAGDALKIDIADAIFDGRSLVMAWSSENTSEETIYLLCDTRVNGNYTGQGSYGQVDEIFLSPGEITQSGMSMRIDETNDTQSATLDPAESCRLTMTFSVLRPTGEIVRIGAMDGDGTEADDEAYRANIDRLNGEGKVVLAPDGVIELGSNHPPYVEGMTRTDIYTQAGVLELIETVEVDLTIAQNSQPRSLLPDGPVEKDNGDYTLRIVTAELTPNSGTFVMERVFADEAAKEKFSAYWSEKLGPMWTFAVEDTEGGEWYGNMGGSNRTETPVRQADGTWVWTYDMTMTGLYYMPEAVTVVPLRDDVATGAYNVPFPEEGITLAP